MIVISRSQAVTLLTIVALVALPWAMSFSPALTAEPGVMIPILLAVELLVYFVLSMVANPAASLGAVIGLSVLMVLARLSCVVVGVSLAAVLGDLTAVVPNTDMLSPVPQVIAAVLSNAVFFLIHLMTMLVASPHVVDALLPTYFSAEGKARLHGDEAPVGDEAAVVRVASAPEHSAKGGFVQVFSFEELSGVLRKSTGLEGFLIYNNEGLLVWRDLPMRLEVDDLVAQLSSSHHQLSGRVERGGLTRVSRLAIELRDHLVFVAPLNAGFGMVLVYSGRVSPADCFARLGNVARTAREFLQWKYPALSGGATSGAGA